MHVAIDGRSLQSRPIGGIGRILRAVVPELCRSGVERVQLLTDARRPPPDMAAVRGVDVRPLRAPVSGRSVVWLERALPNWLESAGRDLGVDVLHCPFYGVPRRQAVPVVASIYDTTFLGAPAWVPMAQRIVMRNQARRAARTARVVITGSETVAKELGHDLAIDADRIVVAAPAPDPVFAEAGEEAARRAHDKSAMNGGRRYVVALAGSRRRNLRVAVAAWRDVRRGGHLVDLVVIGPLSSRDRRLVESAGGNEAGTVGDPELAAWLAGADAFIYPTSYEGIGMPALEAMAAGTPIVCAPVGALPEVLGSAGQWCSADGFTAGLKRVLDDHGRAAELTRIGLCRARSRPSPADSAQRWVDAYRRACAS